VNIEIGGHSPAKQHPEVTRFHLVFSLLSLSRSDLEPWSPGGNMLATLKIQPRFQARPAISPPVATLPPAPSPATPLKRLLRNRHFQPVLVASRPVHVASRSSVGGSILTHFGMGALIIVATLSTPSRPNGESNDQPLIFLSQVAPAQPALPAPAVIPRPPAANPPPKGFQTIATPTVIPTEIPPVNLEEQPLDPGDFTGIGVEGGVADGVAGGTGEVDPQATGPWDGIYDEATADARYTPARILRQSAPMYPPALRQARIEGSVVIRFVVDTLGRVEPASIEVLESSRPTFDQPAIQAILATRFATARFDNRGVRQLTNQRISFRLR
jgi:TonB family protein